MIPAIDDWDSRDIPAIVSSAVRRQEGAGVWF